jgi:BASS family bile acid:Na+ symporter
VNWAVAAKTAFGVSLAVLVFGSGLGARFSDVSALLRRPALLARSLISMLVVAPALAVALVSLFDLNREVAIALVALSISPLPPLLPSRGERAGGRPEFGLGLVLLLAVLSVPIIMASAAILQAVFGRDYVATPWAITRLLTLTMVAPLVAGMVLARISPPTARRLEGPLEKMQRWLLPIAMIVLLISAAPDIWSLIGNHSLTAIGIFVVGTFAVGHLLGGSDRQYAAVLAFASSCRHPATALALASANFPGIDEHAAVALYGVVTAIVGALYTVWLRRSRSSFGGHGLPILS